MLIPTVTRSVCMGQKPEHLCPWQEASGLSAGSEHPIKIQLPKFGEVLMGLPPLLLSKVTILPFQGQVCAYLSLTPSQGESSMS